MSHIPLDPILSTSSFLGSHALPTWDGGIEGNLAAKGEISRQAHFI